MKISHIQIFWIIVNMELGMTLLMTMTASLQAAKQDAWISIILSGCLALLVALIATRLALLYPGQTLVQFSQTIMGKTLGRIIVMTYLIQWYTIIPIVLRQFTDLVRALLLETTPQMPITLIMIALMVYATYAGKIQGIGRCSEMLGPLVIAMVLFVLATSLPNISIKNILPVYADSGMMSIGKGMLAPASYLGHAIEFVMLTPFLVNAKKGASYAIWGVFFSVLFVLSSMSAVILTMGPEPAGFMWYPFFEMTRNISIGFIENWDALVVIIWISSVFIKLSIYMFITCYGTAQFLQVKNWRIMIWLVAPVAFLFSLYPTSVIESTNHYLLNYWVPIVLPVNMIGLPLLMLIVGVIKKKLNPS